MKSRNEALAELDFESTGMIDGDNRESIRGSIGPTIMGYYGEDERITEAEIIPLETKS